MHVQGWNVVSLDLPCHGANSRSGDPVGLEGWAACIAVGEDIVSAFREQVNDVLEHLVKTGVADPDRLAAAGTSRGGFMAFHAAAGNSRIRAVAAFAPVTDLGVLSEFVGQEDNALVIRLSLIHAIESLANRAAWITIGNADTRVDTDKVVAFVRALENTSVTDGVQKNVALHVVSTPGHTSLAEWHDQAADWLKDSLNKKE
jgi:dienelactone hydrolase